MNSIRRIVRALRVSSREAEKRLGISGAQLFVLQKLSGKSPISMNELAARTHTHQSSVSVVVARLVRDRLVKRVKAADDARRLEISLTDAGRSFLGRAGQTAQEKLARSVEQMDRADRAALSRLLESVETGAGYQVEAEAPLFFEKESHARQK
jgi:DNA-binding MarR family transcriptional regulator